MFSISTLCTVCALTFMAVPPKGEGSSDEGGKCPITGLFSPAKKKAAEAAVPAEVGKVAPPFELMDTNGKAHKLSDFKGKWVVLAFYPADGVSLAVLSAGMQIARLLMELDARAHRQPGG